MFNALFLTVEGPFVVDVQVLGSRIPVQSIAQRFRAPIGRRVAGAEVGRHVIHRLRPALHFHRPSHLQLFHQRTTTSHDISTADKLLVASEPIQNVPRSYTGRYEAPTGRRHSSTSGRKKLLQPTVTATTSYESMSYAHRMALIIVERGLKNTVLKEVSHALQANR